MKKMFVVFGMMMVLPALADPTIGYDNGSYTYNETTTDGSNMCVNNVLETYSGTANLTAQWEANEIKLRWYNNNTQIIPSTESQTCDYAGALNLPANPTRTGYTFAGWHVRETMNFSSLSLSNGTVSYGKGTNGNISICYWYDSQNNGGPEACKMNSQFTELENNEWKTVFSNGILYGMSHCSKKSGDSHGGGWQVAYRDDWETVTINELDIYNGDDVAQDAKYCWCKATGWKAEGQSSVKGSLSPLAWVLSSNRGSAPFCDNDCASACAYYAQHYYNFRAALFLGSGDAE